MLGTVEARVDYLSHYLYYKENGTWQCRYNNGAKLFHRVGQLFYGGFDNKSGRQKENQKL